MRRYNQSNPVDQLNDPALAPAACLDPTPFIRRIDPHPLARAPGTSIRSLYFFQFVKEQPTPGSCLQQPEMRPLRATQNLHL